MTNNNHRRTFISYSRVNKEFAGKLAKELRNDGFPVWFDLLDIPTGSRWDDEVEKALRECPIFLIILTPAAINSENVKDEIGYAIDHGKRILPVLLENCDVPLRLRRFQYVDFTTKTFQEGFESARTLLDEIVDEPRSMPREEKLVEQKVDVKPEGQTSKSGVTRKTILFGTLMLIVLSGIFGAVMWLGRNKTTSTSSIGMVDVPSGSYPIGTDTMVETTEFWIDRYEVTNSEYEKFVGGITAQVPSYWGNGEIPAGQRDHPVMAVTWDQAKEYCDWAGKRLPTETEWEIAARGPFGWIYPWGNNPDRVKQKTDGTTAVYDNAANRSYFGAYFMSGNVWEWVSEPYTPTAENEHVMRGGAYGPLDVLTVALAISDDSGSNRKTGFRCAASGENVLREYDDALAISDDFETSSTNWPGINMDNFLFDYHEVGFYHVEAREANKYVPAFYEHDTFSNFVLETQVFVDKLNTDNQQGNFLYGLGIQVADDKFYAFMISAKDRKWQVVEGPYNRNRFIGNVSDLTLIKDGTENSIMGDSSEQAEDRLTVIANGNDLLYYVNGDLVYDFPIADHQKLEVGFVVETLADVTRVHIHYNWVTLQNIALFDN